MSNAIPGLVNILLEIETYNHSQIPPYRYEEVKAAELALASARVDYRALLLHHKMSIEKSVEVIQRLRLQIESDQDEPLSVKPDKGVCGEDRLTKLRHDLQNEQRNLKQLSGRETPDVALTVLTSRFQQLERGLKIYKYKRAIRIINLAFDLVLTNAPLTETTAARLSTIEQKLLAMIKKLLDETGLHNKMRDLPSSPSCDRGRAWAEPPIWLIETVSEMQSSLENMENGGSETLAKQNLSDIVKTVGRINENLQFRYADMLPMID